MRMRKRVEGYGESETFSGCLLQTLLTSDSVGFERVCLFFFFRPCLVQQFISHVNFIFFKVKLLI